MNTVRRNLIHLAFGCLLLGESACDSKEVVTEDVPVETEPTVASGSQPGGSGGSGGSSVGTVVTLPNSGSGGDEDETPEAAAPVVVLSQPDGTNDSIDYGGYFPIVLSGSDADSDALIALYYKTANTNCAAGLTGWVEIATGLPKTTANYVWNTDTIDPGTYFICAVITDATNLSSYTVSSHAVTIVETRFVTRWQTDNAGTSNSDQITLPLPQSGTYNFVVNWGDGTSDTITAWNDAAVTHTYPSAGSYTVAIQGDILGWNFYYGGDKLKITEVSHWGSLRLVNDSSYFAGATNLTITAEDVLDLTGVNNLTGMFQECTSLTGIPNINDWDVSMVVAMTNMFMNSNFNSDIGDWDVGNVSDTDSMFYGVHPFNQDLSSWNTANLYNAEWMFYDTSMDQDFSSWDIRNVYDMDRFLLNTPLSTENYDKLLISWAAQVTSHNKSGYWFSTNATYSPAASAAHTVFAGNAGGFSDGGPAPQ